jgi:hypothetical protein
MLGLRDLQSAFAAHLGGEDRADLARAVIGDRIPAVSRLRIHRHHVRQSLASALATTFPTVHSLVGEAFFQRMAEAFVVRELPRQPVLAEYGEGFPAHVADYGPAASLAYLADVARLDWALNIAFQAPSSGRLAAEDLTGIEPERLLGTRLSLAAGASVIQSRFPIDRIWRATRPEAPPDTVDLEEGGATLLVLRAGDDAAFASLSAAEAAFLLCLDGQDTLEEAAQAAFSMDRSFDLPATFARLMATQAFAALQQESSIG